VTVLDHHVKKPGCKDEIMEHFARHPETGVTHPSQIAIVGDRLATDMMLANMMGSWGLWIQQGVKPMEQKGIVSHCRCSCCCMPVHHGRTGRLTNNSVLEAGTAT